MSYTPSATVRYGQALTNREEKTLTDAIDSRITERGGTVAVVRFKDGRPDPAQSCRFVGETRPWCVIHSDWWASEGRCNSAPTQELRS